ncbi:MAG: rod shape-determining protein MreD [Spirochaetales bacterium]|nr:rod shape-determining protein MreD [Spirochaetales bacterium]
MNQAGFVFHTLLIALSVILQSTLLRGMVIRGATPDIALIILVFSAHHLGEFRSLFSGFISGLIEDFLSLSPLGFHAFLKTLIGYLNGLFKGKIFFDPIFIPMIVVLIATTIKAGLGFLLLSLFNPAQAAGIFQISFWIELGMNVVLAPFIFALLKLFRILRPTEKEGYR